MYEVLTIKLDKHQSHNFIIWSETPSFSSSHPNLISWICGSILEERIRYTKHSAVINRLDILRWQSPEGEAGVNYGLRHKRILIKIVGISQNTCEQAWTTKLLWSSESS